MYVFVPELPDRLLWGILELLTFPVTAAEMMLRNKNPNKTISFNNGLWYSSVWRCTAGSQKCMC